MSRLTLALAALTLAAVGTFAAREAIATRTPHPTPAQLITACARAVDRYGALTPPANTACKPIETITGDK